eukprot:scaffold310_cov168-Amphora_coffeaeformis.AAC.42
MEERQVSSKTIQVTVVVPRESMPSFPYAAARIRSKGGKSRTVDLQWWRFFFFLRNSPLQRKLCASWVHPFMMAPFAKFPTHRL